MSTFKGKFNWGMIGILVGTIGIWYSMFTIGFFTTLFYLLSITFKIGIYFNYLENRKG